MIRHHLFVCQNDQRGASRSAIDRPGGGRPCCAAQGSGAVLRALQQAVLRDERLAAEVQVTGCACLGLCLDGPMVVVYPEGVWYRGVAAADAEEIVQRHLLGGEAVERLRLVWPVDPAG